MSLVSTYVRADDGKMYRDPVLEGEGWFVCFDDDDPVELAVADEANLPEPTVFLKDLGITVRHGTLGKGVRNGSRMFGGKFKSAKAWFFDISKPIPAKLITRHDGVVERKDIWQGVIYDPE